MCICETKECHVALQEVLAAVSSDVADLRRVEPNVLCGILYCGFNMFPTMSLDGRKRTLATSMLSNRDTSIVGPKFEVRRGSQTLRLLGPIHG